MNSRALDPIDLPLQGSHLIEASAGTGKTYNIVRLYLRLLLERGLQVQQILVMTFTNAATEELRGRVDGLLRQAEAVWLGEPTEDLFLRQMRERIPPEQALPLLRHAILHLDEAAIFTIHGFCQRVLHQQALASASPMEFELLQDSSELALEAVRDWLRSIQGTDRYPLLTAQGWHQPELFWQKFRVAIQEDIPLVVTSRDELEREAITCKRSVLEQLQANSGLVEERLLAGSKDEQQRRDEWRLLCQWLQAQGLEAPPPEAGKFIHGNRYRNQEDLKALFQPYKDLVKQVAQLAELAELAETNELVAEGILQIRNRFRDEKQRREQMDFDDLVRQLAERLGGEQAGHLIQALRQGYPAALVDEFQDTDPRQYAILNRLYLPWNEGFVALIGDPKQAIYGFRGGDVFTYLEAAARVQMRWHLDANWRSSDMLVAAYNRLFCGNPAALGAGVGYTPVAARGAPEPLRDAQEGRAALNYVWIAPEKPANAAFRQVMADWMAGEIQRLLRQARLGERPLQESDIAILVRDGIEADICRQALARAGYRSVYLSARDSVFDSEEAGELLRVLQGILECEQTPNLIAAFSTRLLGGGAQRLAQLAADPDSLVEARYTLMELRQLWIRQGIGNLLLRLVQQHLVPTPQRHERCLTNYMQLLELLQQASGSRRHPQQLLEWLKQAISQTGFVRESELRLESDERLVRIITQHGAKGLEYPVVFIPFASYGKAPSAQTGVLRFHPPEGDGPRLAIGQHPKIVEMARQESDAELARLLYVAVTRAKQRCYLCIAPFARQRGSSPLHLLLGAPAGSDLLPALQSVCSEAGDQAALLQIMADAIAISPGSAGLPACDEAQVSPFSARISREWRIASFSALASNAGHARQDLRDEEPDSGPLLSPVARARLPLRYRLPPGAEAGTLLHDILEVTDFSQPRWSEVLQTPLARYGTLDARERQELQAWLQACLDTPLPGIGPAGSLKLSHLNWGDTLRESEFYLPMKQLDLSALAQLLAEHRGDARRLELPGPQRLGGMMHGFIDLVFCHQGRYYLADYKSSYLGDRPDCYLEPALMRNNRAHWYDLQYLIYSLALHRYLANRLPDYDPGRHLGGVYYLYLRGMSPDNPLGTGVYSCSLSVELIRQLDLLFQVEEDAA